MSEIAEKYQDNASRYTFPFINTEHDYKFITVELRGTIGEDRWAIVDSPYCYQPKGRRWAYERSNSSRTDRFLDASRMTLEEALPLAEKLAAGMRKEWETRLARMIARQEAAEAAEAAETAQEDS
jgi:hypothetical protein